MVSATIKDVAKDWQKAEKYICKGKMVSGKKILCHAMRSLQIALQLVESKGTCVDNFHVCSDLHVQLQSMHNREWGVYDSLLRDKRDELICMLQAQN